MSALGLESNRPLDERAGRLGFAKHLLSCGICYVWAKLERVCVPGNDLALKPGSNRVDWAVLGSGSRSATRSHTRTWALA